MARGHKTTLQSVLLRLIICEPAALETGCWEWPGAKCLGYGVVKMDQKQLKVHRVVYEHFRGKVPDGLELDHLCRNKACANFEHLEPVTASENCFRAPRALRDRTHCCRGHLYDEANTYWRPRKNNRQTRVCRECAKQDQLDRRRRERGE